MFSERASESENREKKSEGQKTDSGSDQTEDNRFDESDRLVHLLVGATFDRVGYMQENFVEFIGFFGDGNHRHDLIGKEATSRKRKRERFTIADTLSGRADLFAKET